MQFARDGSLYMLEYGTTWNERNEDARLIRIEYTAGNRKPVPKLAADKTQGPAPMTVKFSSTGSLDHDGDEISFEWDFGIEEKSNEANPEFTFVSPGVYPVTLTVTDAQGNSSSQSIQVEVGNDPPAIAFEISGNSTFFFQGQQIAYNISVKDLEDGSTADGTISKDDIMVTYSFNPEGKMKEVKQLGHQSGGGASGGLALIQGSDCLACHDEVKKSIGPSYNDVALKYKGDSEAREYLAGKIISGGGGVWGDQAMAAHPQLSMEDVNSMVKYILSLGNKNFIPLAGSLDTPGESGYYILSTEYKDKGGDGIGPITARESIYLRSTKVPAVDVDRYEKSRDFKFGDLEIMRIRNGTIFVLDDIDLTGIKSLSFRGSVNEGAEAKLEVRSGSVDGELLSTVDYVSSGTPTGTSNSYWVDVNAALPAVQGIQDLYFVVTSNTQSNFGSMSHIIFNLEELVIE